MRKAAGSKDGVRKGLRKSSDVCVDFAVRIWREMPRAWPCVEPLERREWAVELVRRRLFLNSVDMAAFVYLEIVSWCLK